jgi:hypothetical protein
MQQKVMEVPVRREAGPVNGVLENSEERQWR